MRIFLEAEQFDDPGGWVVDTQSFEALGACYLLAHGIGRPVRDAETAITTATEALWHVGVRTRDWTAEWKRGRPAGVFQLLIDGVPQEQLLGVNGGEWAWQYAGCVKLGAGKHRIALHDLTGFDGRCDAVCFYNDPAEAPPEDRAALDLFRRACLGTTVEEDPVEYDLLICGGGFAGLCAGLAAQSRRLKFKVIQDRHIAGGCGSSEVRVWVGGAVGGGEFPALGQTAAAISPIAGCPGARKTPEMFEDHRKTALFQPGTELLLDEMVIGVETVPGNPRKIQSVVTRAVRTGRETRRRAALFVDCTGDALLARSTGCETMYGCEGRAEFNETLAPEQPNRMVMGHSTLWSVNRCDHKVEFPDIDWGVEFNAENALFRFDSCWDWETGQYRDQVMEIERIRDYGLMSCYANWSFLKNRSARKSEWENMELEWVSPIGGKRESFRVRGDLVLTQNDVMDKTPYDDATAAITWSIDLHYPDPENEAKFHEAFQSCAYHLGIDSPYAVPYRCLYAKDMDNLFLGGRCLSASHVAFSCIRVMRTLGMLGEVIAMAAAICRRHECTPKEIYSAHLDELKESMRRGVPLGLPCAYPAGTMEAYHFMRPIGRFGNPTEDCWLRFGPDGEPLAAIPEPLQENIAALNLIHRNGRKFK